MAAPSSAAQANLTLNLLALGNFVVGMGAFVVIGIITPVADGLGVSKADAGIILTAYAIAYALLSPIGAALTGNLPRRTVLVGALSLFCAGSILSAVAPSLGLLTLSRLLVACGAALFTPLSAGMAVAIAPPEQRGRALARVFGGITAAQVVGVPLGAWLAYRFGWQAPFGLVALLAALSAAILFRAIPTGVTFQATTIAAVVSALTNVAVMFATALTATLIAAIYIVFTYFGPLIEASAGANAEARTFFLVLYGIGAVLGNYMGGFLSDRIGPRRTLLVICISQVLLMPPFSIMPWGLVPFAILVMLWSCFGWSFMAAQQSRLVAMAPQAQALVLALNAAMIYVGIAIGSGIAARLLDWQGLGILGICGGFAGLLAILHLWFSGRPAKVACK